MKIKKHGTTYKGADEKIQYESFKCDHCKCEFSCSPDEYYVDLGGADTSYPWSISCTIERTIKDWLVCSCPECHRIVKKMKERVIETVWSAPNITLTGTGEPIPLKHTEITCNADYLNEI